MFRRFGALAILAIASHAYGQAENPDYRIRADFRDAGDESVGNAKFLIKSRYGQLYYGGVVRRDEYRFVIELSDSSLANRSFDVFLTDVSVGTLSTNSSGYLEQTYRSDWKPDDAPDQPLPENFPDPVNVGDVVSVYDSLTQSLLFSAPLVEEFMRGDADQDGDVDDDDLEPWHSNYGHAGVGPAGGDYSGDNYADGADLLVYQRNYTGDRSATAIAAAVPEPTCAALAGLALTLAGVARHRTR